MQTISQRLQDATKRYAAKELLDDLTILRVGRCNTGMCVLAVELPPTYPELSRHPFHVFCVSPFGQLHGFVRIDTLKSALLEFSLNVPQKIARVRAPQLPKEGV